MKNKNQELIFSWLNECSRAMMFICLDVLEQMKIHVFAKRVILKTMYELEFLSG